MSGKDLEHISLALYQYLCKHIVGTEETVKTRRILNAVNDRMKNHISITSGSFGEGLEMKGSDKDHVFVINCCEVYEDIKNIRWNPAKTYFQMITEDTQPGYVKLQLLYSSNSMLSYCCTKAGSELYLSNSLFKAYFSNTSDLSRCMGSEVFHGPCLSDQDETLDIALSVKSSLWISPAIKWITRACHQWPSGEAKANIIEHGVLFVPVGVKESPNEEIEWRVSFSVGEKLLIFSFSHTQLLCYALMKILLKDILNTDQRCKGLLCSYYLKNILFWICEELPLSTWTPEYLLPCFMQCYERLIYCVKYEMCVHYFIPENNMFENKMERRERLILLDNLYALHSMNWRCLLFSHQLTNFVDKARILSLESHLFDQYFVQMACSQTLNMHFGECKFDKIIKILSSYRSSRIQLFHLRKFSQFCNDEAQNINLRKIVGNKSLYRQYKTCQCYLAQNVNHDAVSGWLVIASMFYQMRQYNNALEMLSYSLAKCTIEKFCTPSQITVALLELLTSEKLKSLGLIRLLRILRLKPVTFQIHSSLIPKELRSVVTDNTHILPPVVYAHFLSFLCHYHRDDIIQCSEALGQLQITILEDFFLPSDLKAEAYDCLGVAFQLAGDVLAAKEAYTKALEHKPFLTYVAAKLSTIHR